MTQNAPIFADRVLAFGTFRLFMTQRLLLEGERQVRLGSRALEILFALIEQPGEVVSKARLMHRVWPDVVVEEGTLRVHIAALRRVLSEGHTGTRYVENVTGHGYRFIAPVAVISGPVNESAIDLTREGCALTPTVHRMIGRAEVVSALVAQVPKRRFVTIVGAGGIGKTTVAFATAERLRSAHPHGVYCVDLAVVDDPARVASALASVFRLPVFSADPLPNLIEFLASRQLLILLDNCEHVVESAARIAEVLLRRCASVCVLATSREPLRAEGEWIHRLSPLELPMRDDLPTTEALGYAAIQLFVERATASTGSFELQDEEVSQVAQICRKLDGLPLAIELAAAAVDRFGLRGLASRIGDHLQVLRSGRRTALPRHRTLRATLDWSYDTLSLPEQQLLRRLAVFASSFGARCAAVVAAIDDLNTAAVSDQLAELAGKSLVAADVDGEEVRYRLLDTTRAYALDKLSASGEGGAVRRKHAELCASWRWDRPCKCSPALEQIAEVRTALDWCFSAEGDACVGSRLIAQSALLWLQLSFLDEYGRRIDAALQVLSRVPAHEPTIEMELSVILGEVLLFTQGPGPRVVSLLTTAQQLAEAGGDLRMLRRCLWGLHSECVGAGRYTSALEYAQHWRTSRLEKEDDAEGDTLGERMLALAYHLIGAQHQAQLHAERVLTRPMSVSRARATAFQLDDRVGALGALSRALWIQGFPERARAAGHEAVSIARSLDHALSLCHALACAGIVELWNGNRELALRIANELSELGMRHSLSHWQHWGTCIHWALEGEHAGIDTLLSEARATSFHTDMHEEALATFDDTLATTRAIERGEHGLAGWCAPELLRIQAIGLQRAAEVDTAHVTSLLEAALELAQRQGALSWELRVALSLAQWQAPERRSESRNLVRGVLERFTEGERTADLVAARAFLKAPRPIDSVAAVDPPIARLMVAKRRQLQ